jgi:hypothetical protein
MNINEKSHQLEWGLKYTREDIRDRISRMGSN